MFFLHLVNFFITTVHLLSAALLFIFPRSLSPRWRVECSPPRSLSVAVRFRIESHPERLSLSRNQVFFSVLTYIWHWGELRVLWSLSAEMEASLCSSHADPWLLFFVPRKQGITLPSPVVPLPAVMVRLECWGWNTEQNFVNFSGPGEVRNCFCTSF